MRISKNIILKHLNGLITNGRIIDKDTYINFRCPFCGDSKKNKNKQRGNIVLKGSRPFFRCFNCDKILNIFDFFSELDYNTYIQFKKDVYWSNPKPDIKKENNNITKNKFIKYLKENKKQLKYQDTGILYLKSRGIEITDYILNDLYYIDNLENLYSEFFPNKTKVLGRGILIPTYNWDKKINGFQIRLLNKRKSPIRYVTLKLEDGAMLFNLKNVDFEKHIYLNEGFFDGQFLENSINTNLSAIKTVSEKLTEEIDPSKITIVLDNEHEKNIIKTMEKMIEKRFNVFIWPKEYRHIKDINALYTSEFRNKKEELKNFIKENSFSTIKAKMKFIQWKKLI